MKGIKNMDNLKAPKGYELTPRMREGEWYDYYLSRDDYGIMGGLTVQPDGILFDYFTPERELVEFRAASIADALELVNGWAKK